MINIMTIFIFNLIYINFENITLPQLKWAFNALLFVINTVDVLAVF